MSRAISWGKSIPFSQDYPLWVDLLNYDVVYAMVFLGLIFIVYIAFGLISTDNLPQYQGSLICCGIMYLLGGFGILLHFSFASREKYTSKFYINDVAIGSSSALSFTYYDDGVDRVRKLKASPFLRWRDVRKVKIDEQNHLIRAYGPLWRLPVTLHVPDVLFDEAVDILKDYVETTKIDYIKPAVT